MLIVPPTPPEKKKGDMGMTPKLHLMTKFQFGRTEQCEAPLHCH